VPAVKGQPGKAQNEQVFRSASDSDRCADILNRQSRASATRTRDEGLPAGAALNAFKGDQHVQVACRFLAKDNERLIFSRVVPSIEGIDVRELYDYDSLWFPVASFGHFVASALCAALVMMCSAIK
jgi:hypothetical protein